jgi:hypothetical protein
MKGLYLLNLWDFCHLPLSLARVVLLDGKATLTRIASPVTLEEIEKVKQEAAKQGIDLSQITIIYEGYDEKGAALMGSFAEDGTAPNPEKIKGFYYLGAD